MKRSTSVTTPSKKRTKTASTKRSSKKTFYSVPRPLVQYKTGFPKQLAITHKYCANLRFTWTSPATNVSYEAIGTNCLYDPYLGVGGLQPLYFDQLSAIYNHYTVMKSRFRMTVVPSTVDPFVAGVYIDDDAAPAVTALDVVCEQPSAVYLTSQRDAQVVTVYKSWDCKSVFGPNPMDNDRLQGDSASNPSEIQAFIPFVRVVNPGASSSPVYFDAYMTVEYDTVWNELRVMTGS